MAAGAVAKLMLREIGVSIESGVVAIDGIEAEQCDFAYAKESAIYALDPSKELEQMEAIDRAREAHDSVGGEVLVQMRGVPVGLGEPLYHKLDAKLAEAMMGINAVKGVEIGDGAHSSRLKGSVNNDEITKEGFVSNHSGGILGGISNGDTVVLKVYFKPTPSIFKPQRTIDTQGNEREITLKGRHDPCVAIRGSVVAEAMAASVLADMVLLNMSAKMDYLKTLYR